MSGFFCIMCPRLDSNQHTRRRCDLNTVRLPISPLGHFRSTKLLLFFGKQIVGFKINFWLLVSATAIFQVVP